MLNNYSDEQLCLAARLYYLDNLPQAEIAKFVKVSQAKVSRLLTLARERGIVRISVAEYDARNASIEKQLAQKLGISAVVIKAVQGLPMEDARRTVAHFAAPYISALIPNGSVVATSGGRTISELAQLVPEANDRQITVVQGMGSIDSNVGAVDALEIGRTLARRWGGLFLTLNAPAFMPDKKTRDAFLAHDQIAAIRKRLSQADVALIGVGTLDNSVFVERGVLTGEDIEKLKARGAVGEVCGRFFDKHGRECETPWRDRVISIDLAQLRKTPQVIAIVAGGDRSAAITAAIRGGLIKTLVIDEPGANALLAENLKPKGRK